MSDPVLFIIIGLVLVLGPALILRMPADLRWGRGPQEDLETDTGELPELLRRPPRARPSWISGTSD